MPLSKRILPHGKKAINASSPNYYTTTGTLGDNNVLTGSTNKNGVTWTANLSSLAGGGGTPGGSTTQLQYNNGGAFAGAAAMTYNSTDEKLVLTSSVAGKFSLKLKNNNNSSVVNGLLIADDADGSRLAITHSNVDNENNIWGYENIPMKFATNNTERMRIQGGGNVGINQTTPVRKLHVVEGSLGYAARFEDGIELDGSNVQLLGYGQGNLWLMGNSGNPKLTLGYSHNWNYQVSLEYLKNATPNVGLSEFKVGQTQKNATTYDHGITSFYTSGSETMRLTANNRVGIGTTTPNELLDVSGNQKLYGHLEITGAVTNNPGNNHLWASGTGLYWGDKEVYTNTPGTSEITGGGSSGQVTYFDGTSTITGSAYLTYDGLNLTLASAVDDNTSRGLSIKDNEGTETIRLGTSTSDHGLFYLRGATGGNAIYLDGGAGTNYLNAGNVGIGNTTAIASAKLTVRDTSDPQLTLAYDGTYYTTLKTDSAGDFHVNLTSGGTFNFGQSAGNEYFKFLRGNGSGIMSLRDSGHVYFNGGNVIFETATQQYFQLKGTNVLGFGSGRDFSMSASGNVFYMTSGATSPSATPILGIKQDGSVGIGTSSPDEYLEVRSSADDDPAIRLTNNRSGASGSLVLQHRGSSVKIKSENDQPMGFVMDSTEVITIHSDNNVGIGTTAPGKKLHVQGDIAVSGASTAGDAGKGHSLFMYNQTGTQVLEMYADSRGVSGGKALDMNVSGKLNISSTEHLGIGPSSTGEYLHLFSGPTSHMYLDAGDSFLFRDKDDSSAIRARLYTATGKFILNDSTPATQIELNPEGVSYIAGNFGVGLGNPQSFSDRFSAQIGSDSGWPIGFVNAAEDVKGGIRTDQGDNYIAFASKSESDIRFFYNDAEANTALIVKGSGTTAGNVGIGTTDPNYKLDVYADVPSFVGRFKNTSNNGYVLRLEASDSTLDFQTDHIIYSYNMHMGDDTRNLYLRTLGKKLGVGTSSPATAVHVSGTNIVSRFQDTTGGAFTDVKRIAVETSYAAVVAGGQGQALGTTADANSDLWVNGARYFRFRHATGSTTDGATTYMSGSVASSSFLEIKTTGSNYSKGAVISGPNELYIITGDKDLTFNSGRQLTTFYDNEYVIYNDTGNPVFHIRSGSSAALEFEGDGDMRFKTTGTSTKMSLMSSGRLGIGTTGPDTLLHVDGDFKISNGFTQDWGGRAIMDINMGSVAGADQLRLRRRGANTAFDFDMTTDGQPKLYFGESGSSNTYILGESDTMYIRAGHDMYFNIDTDNDSVLRHFIWRTNTSSELMRLGEDNILEIKSGGKVGIGVAAPGEVLDVVGNARIRSNLAVGTNSQPTSSQAGARIAGILQMDEKGSVPTHAANTGILWVKDDSPTNLYFTDSNDNDIALTDNGSAAGGGGGGTPAGSNKQIQFNNSSAFGGSKLLYETTGTNNAKVATTGSLYLYAGDNFHINSADAILLEPDEADQSGGDIKIYDYRGGTQYTTFKGSTQRVGLGTDNPSAKFEIKNASSNWAMLVDQNNTGNLAMKIEGNYGLGIETAGQYPLDISTASSADALRMLDNGNLGIGTVTPGALLDIHQNADDTALEIAGYDDKSGVTAKMHVKSNGMAQFVGSSHTQVKATTDSVYISAAEHLYLDNGTRDTYSTIFRDGTGEYARFKNARLGIGSTNPGYPLHVVQNSGDTYGMYLFNNGSKGIYFGDTNNNGTGFGKIGGVGGSLFLGSTQVYTSFIPTSDSSANLGQSNRRWSYSFFRYGQFGYSDQSDENSGSGGYVLGVSGNANRHPFMVKAYGDDGVPSFIVTSGSKVGIGTDSPDTALHIESSTSSEPVITIENTNADNTPPGLTFFKNTASPASGDQIGSIKFNSKEATSGDTKTYWEIQPRINDATNTTPNGQLNFYGLDGDSPGLIHQFQFVNSQFSVLDSNGVGPTISTYQTNGGQLKTAGSKLRLQAKSDSTGEIHMMASTVGIGTTSPAQGLHVVGNITTNALDSEYRFANRSDLLIRGNASFDMELISPQDMAFGIDADDNETAHKFLFKTNSTTPSSAGTTLMEISEAGDVSITGGLAVTGSTLAVQKTMKNDIVGAHTFSDSYSHYLATADNMGDATCTLTCPASPTVGDEYFIVARCVYASAAGGSSLVRIQPNTGQTINAEVNNGSYIALNSLSSGTGAGGGPLMNYKTAHLICVDADTWALTLSDVGPTS